MPAPVSHETHGARPGRTASEIDKIRQARRDDIVRRCMALDPPLPQEVLQHIQSFQAAMQITQPMTDGAWERLKPRILAQREHAETLADRRAEQLLALQASTPSALPNQVFSKLSAKDLYGKDYERLQVPLRARLAEYAMKRIDSHWNGRRETRHKMGPALAVDVLLHIQQSYMADERSGSLPVVDQSALDRLAYRGASLPAPFLSLDNMKWVFEHKIRQHIAQQGPTFFICAVCSVERPTEAVKKYAFEGLIQHYGSVHTDSFRRGTASVQWQTSEWPEEPPFHTDPMSLLHPTRSRPEDMNTGRQGKTPQASGDAFSQPSQSGHLLSENPYFARGAVHAVPHHGGIPAPQGADAHMADAEAATAPAPVGPMMETILDQENESAAIDYFCAHARSIWDLLEGVDPEKLIECIRVQTSFVHAYNHFFSRFQEMPTLDLVIRAFATRPELRPLKEATGLACSVCVRNGAATDHPLYFARIRDVKLWANPAKLLNHFKVNHGAQQTRLVDVLELPDTEMMTELLSARGMSDDKLAAVASAFSCAFPSPLPKIGTIQEPRSRKGSDSGANTGSKRKAHGKSMAQAPPKKKKTKNKDGSKWNGHGRKALQDPTPEPKADEYDPRCPMVTQRERFPADASRYDTDIGGLSKMKTPYNTGSGSMGLATETLAAINPLGTAQHTSQLHEWRPSVGRQDAAAPSAGPSAPQPDIAAILASLTGQGRLQQFGPAADPANRTGSAPQRVQSNPYSAPPQLTPIDDASQPSAWYAPTSATYPHQPEPRQSTYYGGQDLQPTLERNTRRYEHNQTYASSSAYHPPPTHGYNYVYDEQPAPRPIQHAAPAQVQYVQLPQAQPTVWVDERGRPMDLIPIHNAPARVQYAHNSYEHEREMVRRQSQLPQRPHDTYHGGWYGEGR